MAVRSARGSSLRCFPTKTQNDWVFVAARWAFYVQRQKGRECNGRSGSAGRVSVNSDTRGFSGSEFGDLLSAP